MQRTNPFAMCNKRTFLPRPHAEMIRYVVMHTLDGATCHDGTTIIGVYTVMRPQHAMSGSQAVIVVMTVPAVMVAIGITAGIPTMIPMMTSISIAIHITMPVLIRYRIRCVTKLASQIDIFRRI